MLARLRTLPDLGRWWPGLAALGLLVAAPLVVSGPGNDLDVANVFRSGRAIARHLDYVPSRPPGAPVHEAIVGVLDLLGGPLLTNLASLAAAAAVLVLLHRLLVRERVGRNGRWAVLIVAANPWFVIAATSTADYAFALAFVLGAALAVRSDRTVLAGILAALAMGTRVGSVTLLAAIAAAELVAARPAVDGTGEAAPDGAPLASDRASALRRLLTMGAVAVPLTLALFVPSMVAAGGLSFAENDFSTSSPLVQLGRALAKDALLLGIPASLVVLAALPALWRALQTWRASWLVRFATVGLVLSQLLFVRFPWKVPHLLPSLVCLVILLAVAFDDRPAHLLAIVALQVAFAVVRVDVLAPDDPNQATGGRIEPSVGWGPLVTDWQCRREHEDAYLGRQKVEVEAAWECAKPFGG